MNLDLRTPVHLRTRLSQEDVIARLRNEVSTSLWARIIPLFGGPVIGSVKGSECRLRVNSLSKSRVPRELSLTIRANERGTSLDGEFAITTPALLFGGLWFLFLVMFCLAWCATAVRSMLHGGKWNFDLLTPVVPLAVSWPLLWFNLVRSRSGDRDLLEFLRTVIAAEPASSGDLAQPASIHAGHGVVAGNVVMRPRHENPHR